MSIATQQFVVEDTFGIEGAKFEVPGYAANHAQQMFVPKLDKEYAFRKEVASTLLLWWKMEDNPLWLWGPMGSGKSSALTQMAARLNVPCQVVTCHDELQTPDLIGRYVPNGEGGFDFVDGPLLTAMRFGQLLILDEIDYLSPATAAGLNGLREGQPITVPETGEVVYPADGFRLAVTSNTNGNGDEYGIYSGTNRMNQAFMDGFVGLQVGYPEKQVEVDLLQQVMPGIDQRLIETMVDIANAIRGAFMGNPENQSEEAIEITMSTRTLLRWGRWRLLANKNPDAWVFSMERALTWRASDHARAFIHGIIEREIS